MKFTKSTPSSEGIPFKVIEKLSKRFSSKEHRKRSMKEMLFLAYLKLHPKTTRSAMVKNREHSINSIEFHKEFLRHLETELGMKFKNKAIFYPFFPKISYDNDLKGKSIPLSRISRIISSKKADKKKLERSSNLANKFITLKWVVKRNNRLELHKNFNYNMFMKSYATHLIKTAEHMFNTELLE